MLELYILETCPYCRKVMNYLDENEIPYNKHDISQDDNLEKLIELGGMQQVPYLYDTENDIGMYESDDIINYIDELGE